MPKIRRFAALWGTRSSLIPNWRISRMHTGSGQRTDPWMEPCPPLPERNITPRSERSEEHTSELQSLMRISYAVFCLKKKKNKITTQQTTLMTVSDFKTKSNQRQTNTP